MSVMNNAINTSHIGAYIGLTVLIALSIYCTDMDHITFLLCSVAYPLHINSVLECFVYCVESL
jgi:hypothetical protein